MRSIALSLFTQLAGYTLAGTLLGLLLGMPLLFSILGALVWVSLQIVSTARLVWWAKHELHKPPPEIEGPLGEVGYKVNRYQRAQIKRRSRLSAVISRFQQSASAMSDAIVIIDAQGAVEWWNQSGNTLIGLEEADRGHSILNLIRHPDFVSFYRDSDISKSLTLAGSQGGRVLEYRIHQFGQGDRVLVARDVTEVHRMEQMRRDFVANASHEMRTPLTVIHGYLEMLQDQELNALLRRAIDTMYSQSSRMESLINDLLELSSLENKNPSAENSSVSIGTLLTQIRDEAIALSGEKRHQITLELNNDIDLIGNPKELQSALSNIVFNAVRYTPEHGSIELAFDLTSEGGAMFRVTDTGVGIDEKHLPRLTERFYRVDAGRSRQDGGTGLGLAIVKHVLNRHDARLEVESRLGRGSEFRCIFPSARVKRLERPAIVRPNLPSTAPQAHTDRSRSA